MQNPTENPVPDVACCCEESGPVRPCRVDVAFEVLHWAKVVECVDRQLTDPERAVYNASLEVLRLYLTGEMDFEN